MNGTDQPSIAPLAAYPQPFPNWPPNSGGYPNLTPEMGPILNPYPYGSTQGANISTSPPSPAPGWPIPWGSLKGTTYPMKMPIGANGQNQAPPAGWPTWPFSRLSSGSVRACTLPDKANPALSQISPAPRMGPAPQSLSWEVGPLPGNPAPGTTLPAGHYIDGLGTTVTPTRVVGGLGN